MLKIMNQFQIYGENNQYVMIQLEKIHGFPQTTSHSGGYDTESSIKIKSGSYYASGSVWISTGEIYVFKNQLKEIYESCIGTAKLTNDEADLEVTVTIENRGRAIIEGRYKEYPSIDNELIFFFEADQSYIGKTLEEINEMTTIYGGMNGIIG
ncbi:hypothetical protein [Paenibacillus sp. XY044]|uniref:WapI family immunity protein n=1 Tax=Paenibacillus sp. XY044 TaxID=2026089 RepID=UPI000B983900|nr:hypothetical protein [Paenibacillus sp. XY044]OZB96159.1 hypothetical protein CJP46_09610 [Paenibacillus sp. XY044]